MNAPLSISNPPARILRLAVAAFIVAVAAQRGFAADPALTVFSAEKSVTFTAEELLALPHMELTATDPHENKEHHYSGVPVRDLLLKVGAPLGESLRGPALRTAVLIHANDGYATLFALAEFDDAFSTRTLLLADSADGKPLPEHSGPLRLVVPGDKRAARWARMVKSIEVIALPDKTAHP
jgi:hypothetical protein